MTAPLDVQSIHRKLLDLRQSGHSQGHALTVEQVSEFGSLLESWKFYKGSQPTQYRAEVDSIIWAIGEYKLLVES
jgi:hypothetical protein